LVPEIFSIANAQKLAIESIADRLSQPVPAATTLAVAGEVAWRERKNKPRGKEPTAILAVQPGWVWEKLKIKLTEKGTLIAQYSTARGEHRFGRKEGPEGQSKYPVLFKILFRMCVAGRWENPPRIDKTYAATQRNFARLRELLQKLVRIDGDPFRKIEGGWEPKFQFEPDRELSNMLNYQSRNRANLEKADYRNSRSFEDELEDADFE